MIRSALRSAVETNSPGPLIETCNCSTSPKSRTSPRAAFSAAFPMTLRIGERTVMTELSRERATACRSVLGALDVTAVGGADDDACPRADMRRDHHTASVLEPAWLVGRGGRLSAHNRVCLDDFHCDVRRQFDGDRRALVEHDGADHTVTQKIGGLADRLARDRDLLEVIVVHEGRLAVFHEQELHLLLVEADTLDSLLCAEALVEFRAAAQVAQLHLRKGAAFAGLDQLALQHEPQLVLVFEDVAGLKVDGIDLHWQDLGLRGSAV